MSKQDALKGYIMYCYSILKNYLPYLNFNSIGKYNNVDSYNRYKLIFKEINEWDTELKELIASDSDFKRQLELVQSITSELKHFYPEYEKEVIINGQKFLLSHVSPRFMWETGLNVVLIKPSAFKLGVVSTIRESFLDSGHGIIDESFPNVGAPSELTGIKPMRMFHPCGYMYERSMDGTGDLMQFNDDADKLRTIKKHLRSQLEKMLNNKK